MRELLERIPRLFMGDTHDLLLLDTCFVIDAAARHRLGEFDDAGRLAMTSFNLEELAHVEHRLETHTRHALRELLKHPRFVALDVPVHPGDRYAERAFVQRIDPTLLREIPDASDAVLIAAALATRSDVLTRDRHHLYTSVLANHLARHGIHVWKEWKDAMHGDG